MVQYDEALKDIFYLAMRDVFYFENKELNVSNILLHPYISAVRIYYNSVYKDMPNNFDYVEDMFKNIAIFTILNETKALN